MELNQANFIATHRRRAGSIALAFLLLVAGCRTTRYADRTDDLFPLPKSYGTIVVATAAAAELCATFGIAELDELIARALENNLDLQAAFARLRQADAFARAAVVNDLLVLISVTNEHRREGKGAVKAIRSGGVRCFRPIVLTSLTTFFGLAPIIFEDSVQARFLIPMALSLGFGVLFVTVVTLGPRATWCWKICACG